VTDNSYYDGTYNFNDEFRVSLPDITDLSAVSSDGNMRFWVNVPKDMTMYFGLASQNSVGTYGRALCQKTLKVSDNDAEGFQEVVIPLSELTIKEGSFSWQDIKFVALRGANLCTADDFLAVGDLLKISPIEFWSGASPEPEAAYTYTPKYYSVNGNITVVDLNVAMDSRTQINAFAHNSFSDEYLKIAQEKQDNTQLLEVYSITPVIAGVVESDISSEEYTEYAVTEANTDMNVLIPVSEEMRDYKLDVGVLGENGFSKKTYEMTDDYLIVNTNELGDFLIMGNQEAVYTASVNGSAVKDNTIITGGVSVVRAAATSEYQPVMTFSNLSPASPSADLINDWLNDDDAQMSIWLKAPYKKEGTVNLQVDLCLRTSSGYPHQSAAVTLAADGYWHELRINAFEFAGNSFASITGSNYNNFYIRIKGNAVGDEYWVGSDIAFYKSPIVAEVNDGNILLNMVAAVDTAETNKGSSVNVSVTKNAEIFDNKFYRNAMVYSVTDALNYSFDANNVTPYKIGSPTGNEFKEAVAGGGDARTYVKNVSDHEMTFTVGIKTWCKITETGKGGNFLLNKTVTVPNDGKWHEVRISFANLNTDEYKLNALNGVEGYTYGTVYLRVFDLNGDFTSTDDKLYITPLEIYNRSIIGKATDDINDANVELEQIAIIDVKDGGGVTNVTVSKDKIADNKFYRTALKYSDAVIGEYSFSGNTYPYKLTTITGTEFNDFIKYHGVWRTYLKNVSDHAMTFKVGVKIRFEGTESGFAALAKEVTVPGDGKWHEIRITYDDLKLNTTSAAYKALACMDGYNIKGIWFHLQDLNGDFTAATDELYITPLEIYNINIEAPETTDFAREYKQTMLLKKYRTGKEDANISKSSTQAENESPFFTNVITYTAKDSYTTSYKSGQIGFIEGVGIDAEAYADWYYNDNADLRFWIKTEKDTKFRIGVYMNGEISTHNAVEVKASADGWQLITIPRSAFSSSEQMENNILSATTVSVNVFFYAVEGTFTAAGDSISFGQCIEFYSDKAYEKGDANRDGKVNLKDLVHLKKQAVQVSTNVKNCDIDNNGSIDALDLTLMRKKLIKGGWN